MTQHSILSVSDEPESKGSQNSDDPSFTIPAEPNYNSSSNSNSTSQQQSNTNNPNVNNSNTLLASPTSLPVARPIHDEILVRPKPHSHSDQNGKAYNHKLYAQIKTSDILKFHRGRYIHYGIAERDGDDVFVIHLWSPSEQLSALKDDDKSNDINVIPPEQNPVLFVPDANDQNLLSTLKTWSYSIMSLYSSVGSAGQRGSARHATIAAQSGIRSSAGMSGVNVFNEIDSAFIQRTLIEDVIGISALGIDSSDSLMVDGHHWRAFDPESVIARAKAKLGQKGYNLLTYNCENFVNECKFGISHSEQIASAVRTLSSTAVTVLSALAMASTATTGTAAVGAASLLGRLTAGASLRSLSEQVVRSWLDEYAKRKTPNNNDAAQKNSNSSQQLQQLNNPSS